MTTPNTDALLPCPFCKSTTAPTIDDDGDDNYKIVCNVLAFGCGASSGIKYSKEEAIATWNTRTPAPSVTSEELENAKMALAKLAMAAPPSNQVMKAVRSIRAILTQFNVTKKE